MRRAAGACSRPETPAWARHPRGRTGAWHRAQPPGDGASMPRRAESYEERSERRQEARERLRGRVNATCCRATVTPGRGTATSPRQAEFLRRRNLGPEAGEALPGRRRARSPQKDSQSPSRGGSSPRCPLASTGTQTLPGSAVTDSSQQTDWGIAVLNKEMVQLSNYLKEALHRELMLKQKMVILQELLSTLLQASEKSWQGQLNEDKLRCKLRVLENQLQACSQSYSKECVKKILIEMEDQKQTYEQKAKEALQKMLEEKLLTEQQLQNCQKPGRDARGPRPLEGAQCHTQSRADQGDHSTHRAQKQLPGSTERAADKLQKEQEQKVTLEATISHLQNVIHNQNNQQKSQEVTVQRTDQVSTTQTPPLTPAKEKQNALSEHPEEEEEEGTESLKDEMQKRTLQLTAKENEVPEDAQQSRAQLRVRRCSHCSSPAALGAHRAQGTPPADSPSLCLQCSELRSELEALSQEYQWCLTRLRQCRDELNRSQGSQAQRQHGPWIPLLVVVAAAAVAAFLATYSL
ncbi:TRAF3-interacting JNK-activating modulator isoform X2 [Ammospiza nelsoni]|uniref:TRAF3-interacting JNK-activating modulator isoform X2 n=1 Tax=Ammospiza nelsoni TaxID=2857394 RepID=UPI00286D4B69|nr:TRAF3-interacting JNK-activating modulator isoform X2 [Ammospiza nelsoni]